MTADDCVNILRHLPVIRQVARGEPVWFAQFCYDNSFIGWRETDRVILGPLGGDYYFTKPRYKYQGAREDGTLKLKPIPPRCTDKAMARKRT